MLKVRISSSKGSNAIAATGKKLQRIDRLKYSLMLASSSDGLWLAHHVGDLLLNASASENPVKMINTASALLIDSLVPYFSQEHGSTAACSHENKAFDELPVKSFVTSLQEVIALNAISTVMTRLFAPFKSQCALVDDNFDDTVHEFPSNELDDTGCEMIGVVKEAMQEFSEILADKLLHAARHNPIFGRIVDDYLEYMGRASAFGALDQSNIYVSPTATAMAAATAMGKPHFDGLVAFNGYISKVFLRETSTAKVSNPFLDVLLHKMTKLLASSQVATKSGAAAAQCLHDCLSFASLTRVLALNGAVREYFCSVSKELNILLAQLAEVASRRDIQDAGDEMRRTKLREQLHVLELIMIV
jgi:hypothetical protein